jgi:hypothetical protein
MFVYTQETYVYRTLNQASRHADASKVDTLGPYAKVLGEIFYDTARKRTDKDIQDLKTKL